MPLGLPPRPPNPLRTIRNAVKSGHKEIERARDELRSLVTDAPETTTTKEEKTEGTACLSCTRDHFSTCSSALSEALRFARSDGMKSPEVVRRLRIAIEELNILERIDLAADQVAMLKVSERELAVWALGQSRDLRHVIGQTRTVEDLEGAAVKAGGASEEFMKRQWELPEECHECFDLSNIRDMIAKKRKERDSGK